MPSVLLTNGDIPRHKFMDKDWLSNQYVKLNKSVAIIAKECNVHSDLIRFYMDRFDIYRPLKKCKHGMVVCQKCV